MFFSFDRHTDGKTEGAESGSQGADHFSLLIAFSCGPGPAQAFEMPYGGTVTVFSMLPIALCGCLLGTRRGVIAGMCVGLLNLIFGPYVIHPVQLLVDYPFAFGALGLAGVCSERKNGLVKGYLLGLAGRYVCAVVSGIVFFRSLCAGRPLTP